VQRDNQWKKQYIFLEIYDVIEKLRQIIFLPYAHFCDPNGSLFSRIMKK
jgi:hypothetical protein